MTDLTYVPTWSGVAYVCFIVDAFSRMIVGWRVADTCAPTWSSTPSRWPDVGGGHPRRTNYPFRCTDLKVDSTGRRNTSTRRCQQGVCENGRKRFGCIGARFLLQ